MTYDQPRNGQWIQPVMRGYRMACCDCSLVHRMNFKIVRVKRGKDDERRVEFQVFRDYDQTRIQRQKMPGHTVICVPRPRRRPRG